MKLNPLFFILLFGFTIIGCKSNRFHARTAFGYDLKDFETFALVPTSDTTRHMLYDAATFRDRINDHVIRELKQRDYTIDTQSPDLLVLVHLMRAGEGDPIHLNHFESSYQYYPERYNLPTASYYFQGYADIPRIKSVDIDDVPYAPESVVIDIVNARNNLLVWRGWTGRSIHPNASMNDINIFVNRFFERYPVDEQLEEEEYAQK